MHTGLPEVQTMEPLKQGLVALHDEPALQLVHTPETLQTWLVPQVEPGALVLPSTHRVLPVLHEVTPF